MYTICCPGWILLTLRTLALQRGNNSIFPCCELFGHCRWSWWNKSYSRILCRSQSRKRKQSQRKTRTETVGKLGNHGKPSQVMIRFVCCLIILLQDENEDEEEEEEEEEAWPQGHRDIQRYTEIYRDIQRYTEIYRDIRRLHNHNSELYRCETNRLNVHHIVVGFWEWKLSPKSLAQEPTSDESVESEDWIGLVPIGYFKPVISFSHTFSTYVSLQFITYVHIVSG